MLLIARGHDALAILLSGANVRYDGETGRGTWLRIWGVPMWKGYAAEHADEER